MPATPKTNTLVTVYVNTRPPEGLSQSNIENHVWMADTDGDLTNDNNGLVANYVTTVKKNGNVTWVGALSNYRDNTGDYVLVTNITFDSNNAGDINVSHEPSSPAGGNPTHINGRVTGNATTTPFSYTIEVLVGSIDSDGNRTENKYTIDPKLQINS